MNESVIVIFGAIFGVCLVAAIGWGAWHQLIIAGICLIMVLSAIFDLKKEKELRKRDEAAIKRFYEKNK